MVKSRTVIITITLTLVLVFFVGMSKKCRREFDASPSDVSRLTEKQIEAYGQRAEAGDIEASHQLVNYYLDHTDDYKAAKKWIEIAIKNGSQRYSLSDIKKIGRIINGGP